MRKLIFLLIFLVFCGVSLGCRHTMGKLSRFNTGNVNVRDLAEAMVDDELAFRKNYW